MRPVLTIGLMSGTSCDGVDAVLLESTAQGCKTRGHVHVPFERGFRAELLSLMHSGHDEIERAGRASVRLADVYISAVKQLQRHTNVPTAHIAAIGAHGQTVRHRPQWGFSVQLNAPARIAYQTGLDVFFDFRSADIAAGGQGAPLVPCFHDRVFRHTTIRRAIVNIGGIANVTVLLPGQRTLGWDTGPGNCLLDAWIERHTGRPYDVGGRWGAEGRVIESLLVKLLDHEYLRKRPPKSTGREDFHLQWLDTVIASAHFEPKDVQATLTAYTAHTIVDAITPHAIDELYVCGGGAFNEELMRHIRMLLPTSQINTTAAAGIDPMQVEAAAFAWFAFENTAIARNHGLVPAVRAALFPAWTA